MRYYRSILFATCTILATSSSYAGNFVINTSESELAADMHASPSHDFTSVAKNYTCDIDINPETMEVIDANCSFQFADLDSGKRSRDKKMCKWMDTDQYPAAEFKMQRQLPDNEYGEHVALGSFTMHGVERPIKVTYTLEREGKGLVLDGRCEINHEDWGLEPVRLLFFSVDTLLKPHFHLVGNLQP